MSGYSEGVEVNLAGWNSTLRRGKGKERKIHMFKGRKEEGKTVRNKKGKGQKRSVKIRLKKENKETRNNSSK